MMCSRESYRTPVYVHCIQDARFRKHVYEPEADTFLFLEALDKEKELLCSLRPGRCVEVGCGSGTVITHLRCLLMPPTGISELMSCEQQKPDSDRSSSVAQLAVGGPQFCVTDVNPFALEATAITWTDTLRNYFGEPLLREFYSRNFECEVPATLASAVISHERQQRVSIDNASPDGTLLALTSSTFFLHCYQGDLLHAFDDEGTKGTETPFDVVLFNPPYVPTSLQELEDAIAQKDVITAAWCGGPRGRVVLNRFLTELPSMLSTRGVCYVVLIKENDIADVMAFAQRVFREHLRRSGASEMKEEEDVLEFGEVAVRYTGEHLSVHRLRYLPPFQRC